jgi:hypothetical protein
LADQPRESRSGDYGEDFDVHDSATAFYISLLDIIFVAAALLIVVLAVLAVAAIARKSRRKSNAHVPATYGCPCCGFKTLPYPHSFEICPIASGKTTGKPAKTLMRSTADQTAS